MLFIIGNGFDIALGLKTSYRDFLNWYLSQTIENEDARITKLKHSIQKDMEGDIDSWADLEAKLGEYTSEYDENEDEHFIVAYRNIKEKLNTYLKSQEGKANYKINGPSVSKEVRKFIQSFYSYFPDIPKAALAKDFSNAQNKITYDFINFNYTNILEESLISGNRVLNERTVNTNRTAYKVQDVIGDVISIHGKIDNSLLLGVDNYIQIKNESFRDQTSIKRILLKPHMNNELQQGISEKAVSLINRSNMICLFDTSLGNSDTFWWRTIGEWLKSSVAKKIVIFWYSKEKLPAIHADIKLTVEDNVRMRFMEQSGLSQDEYDELKHRIFVHVHEDIFKSKLTRRTKKPKAEG